MLLLKVTYRVRAHEIRPFEEIFDAEIRPLIERHKMPFRGIWKTKTGPVGEFLEIWEFADMSDYDRQWTALIQDPRLQEIFVRTGPMVQDEEFTLMTPAGSASSTTGEPR